MAELAHGKDVSTTFPFSFTRHPRPSMMMTGKNSHVAGDEEELELVSFEVSNIGLLNRDDDDDDEEENRELIFVFVFAFNGA